jgi:hypothetical protein
MNRELPGNLEASDLNDCEIAFLGIMCLMKKFYCHCIAPPILCFSKFKETVYTSAAICIFYEHLLSNFHVLKVTGSNEK